MSNKIIQLKEGSDFVFPFCTSALPVYVSMETEDLASVGQMIVNQFATLSAYDKVLFIRVNSVTTGGGVFNRANFSVIAHLSSASYGWAILLSDNVTHNGVVFGRLTSTWKWVTPTMTTVS